MPRCQSPEDGVAVFRATVIWRRLPVACYLKLRHPEASGDSFEPESVHSFHLVSVLGMSESMSPWTCFFKTFTTQAEARSRRHVQALLVHVLSGQRRLMLILQPLQLRIVLV